MLCIIFPVSTENEVCFVQSILNKKLDCKKWCSELRKIAGKKGGNISNGHFCARKQKMPQQKAGAVTKALRALI